ncbi:MAG: glycosyltransferase [Chitinivibrionia bacterium]|nr:glycosyltransferase [Chitinivibrionia bacterium]
MKRVSDTGLRPRILWIKPILPYPPNQGTKVVTFGLLQALQKEYDITVLARLLDRREETLAKELERWCARVVPVLAPNRKSIVHRVFFKAYYGLKSILFRRSLKSLYDCPGAFVRAAERLAPERYDLVVIEYWQLHRLSRLFPPRAVALFTHDIDMQVNRDLSLLERNLFRKIAAVRRWLLERREELRAYKHAKTVFALTEQDKRAVQHIAGSSCRVEVVPFGVDIARFSPPGPERNAGEVLFLGAMSAAFNRDALAFFVTKIYPLLGGIEGLSITIVGGSLPDDLASFARNREVEVVGNVSDIRPFLHRAACMIVPLRYGGGLRIRILEAMAAELPVICTTPAIAGMPFEAGRDYLLADSPEEFAERIGAFMRDPVVGPALAGNAKERLIEHYSKEAQELRVKTLFKSIIDSA